MSAKTISVLRAKTIKAARGFQDYNFRTYFVRHAKERFDSFDAAKATPEEVATFHKDSVEKLCQMRRMALMNSMYASQMVVVDPRAPPMEELEAEADEERNRAVASHAQQDDDDDEKK